MNGEAKRKPSLIEWIAVLTFCAIAVPAIMVLDERGFLGTPADLDSDESVLWTALWFPGMASCLVLFRRSKRPELAVGFLLQAAAIAIYWAAGNARLAAATGIFGCLLPLLPRTVRRTGAAPALMALAAFTALGYAGGRSDGGLAAMLAVIWWSSYRRLIWPAVDKAMTRAEQRGTPAWQRWLGGCLLALLGAFFLVVDVLFVRSWIVGRHPH